MSRREDYYPSMFPSYSGDLFSLSPFALLREMTDLMDRSWTGTPSRSTGRTSTWTPALEVRQKDNNLIVCADLPGVNQNDVKVEIENDALVIQGERKQEHTEEHEGYRRSERSYGSFYRTIPLPEGAKSENAKADFHNGVLEITIPMEQPKSNRRQIQVGTGGASTGSSSSSSSGTTSGAGGNQKS